jgi:DNA-3-methyladenine glycosylase
LDYSICFSEREFPDRKLPPLRDTLPTPLERAFFARDPPRVARELIGKVLVRRSGGQLLTGRIVETEAYLGENDAAAHAAAGHTARNSVLFGPPGHAYVYFIYGTHYCLNVSCAREGKAGGGVLFRALEPLAGMDKMAEARGIELGERGSILKLTRGPGRLAQAFGITRERDNGCDLTSAASSLWIGEDGFRAKKILVTPRIGIRKAVERPLRYVLGWSEFVSGRNSSTSEAEASSKISQQSQR